MCNLRRVSTEDQAERFGLAAQLHELREFASRKGYTIASGFTDGGVSGAALDRPALERLRAFVPTRAVDVVLVPAPTGSPATWRRHRALQAVDGA